jgi:hypothetical protein
VANYGDLVEEVLSIVPLPDKEMLIRRKINQIIRYIAGLGDFWKALEETTISSGDGVDASALIQEITVDSTFRALLYVKYPEEVSTKKIQVLDVKDVLRLENCQKATNVAYMAGGKLRIKHSELTPTFNLGYYVYPANFAIDGSDDISSNWITIAVPGLIVDLTAAYILNLNGDNEDSARAQRMAELFTPGYILAQVNAAIIT